MSKWFSACSEKAASLAGHYLTFIIAILLVVLWAVSGPFLHFSEVWQLTINTGTTIITFLMVFLVQNTQDRDSKAIHVKLDEIIASLGDASNEVMEAETEGEDQLQVRIAAYKTKAEEGHAVSLTADATPASEPASGHASLS